MSSTRWLQFAHQSPTGEPEIELPFCWNPMASCVDIAWSRCQINGTDFSELVVTNTTKELRHIALGCRVSRLPRECMQETHLPRMGYVQNDDGTPLARWARWGTPLRSAKPRVAHFVSNSGLYDTTPLELETLITRINTRSRHIKHSELERTQALPSPLHS